MVINNVPVPPVRILRYYVPVVKVQSTIGLCPVPGCLGSIVHITGIRDYYQCFKCKSILIVKQEEKIG
jgi:hypothetical protein